MYKLTHFIKSELSLKVQLLIFPSGLEYWTDVTFLPEWELETHKYYIDVWHGMVLHTLLVVTAIIVVHIVQRAHNVA